ncbi:amidohydrolase [bacterium]|nr:amidohydrolase [bacterium]
MVGWIDLEQADASEQIHQFARHPHFKGVRLNWLEERPDPDRLESALIALQNNQCSVDVLTHASFLPDIAAYIKRHPSVTWVMDHFGGVALDDVSLKDWRETLRLIAPLTNVVIKLSGYTSRQHTVNVSLLREYIHQAQDIVGAHRLMFGSNWPLCVGVLDYAAGLHLLQDACTSFDEITQAALFHDTAVKTYRLVSTR